MLNYKELPMSRVQGMTLSRGKPGCHFNYAFSVGAMELIIFIIFGNAAVPAPIFISRSLRYRHPHN